jgi:hypothetical protein
MAVNFPVDPLILNDENFQKWGDEGYDAAKDKAY